MVVAPSAPVSVSVRPSASRVLEVVVEQLPRVRVVSMILPAESNLYRVVSSGRVPEVTCAPAG